MFEKKLMSEKKTHIQDSSAFWRAGENILKSEKSKNKTLPKIMIIIIVSLKSAEVILSNTNLDLNKGDRVTVLSDVMEGEDVNIITTSGEKHQGITDIS